MLNWNTKGGVWGFGLIMLHVVPTYKSSQVSRYLSIYNNFWRENLWRRLRGLCKNKYLLIYNLYVLFIFITHSNERVIGDHFQATVYKGDSITELDPNYKFNSKSNLRGMPSEVTVFYWPIIYCHADYKHQRVIKWIPDKSELAIKEIMQLSEQAQKQM